MGITNSCLTTSTKYSRLLCCRSSISDLKDSNHRQTIRKNSIDSNLEPVDDYLLLPSVTRHLTENIIKYRDKHDDCEDADETLNIQQVNSDLLFRHIYDDLSIDIRPTNHSTNLKEHINLNFATYDQLCSVSGLTSNLAEQIITYRKDNGLFHSLKDLLNVSGIDSILLMTIRPFVTVNHKNNQISTKSPSLTDLQFAINHSNSNTKVTLLLISRLLETLPPNLHKVILSSLYSRPFTTHNNHDNCKNIMSDNKKIIYRVASWNLQQLTVEKVQNPGVREVICRVIIDNDLSLIGIQDVKYIESLDLITQELNNPTIPSIKYGPNRRQGHWKWIISDVAAVRNEGDEYLGFLYDESVGISIQKAALLPFQAYFSCLPYIATFRINDDYEVVFVNTHLKAKNLHQSQNESEGNEIKSLSILAQAMKNTIEQRYIVIFGNFNSEPITPAFEALRKRNYSNVIQDNTDISHENPEGATCLDNIWLSYEAQNISTGNSGVIRNNLMNFWIPSGWTWGGLVSNHCPVWTEFDFS